MPRRSLDKWLAQEPSEGRVELERGSTNQFMKFLSEVRSAFVSHGFKEVILPLVGEKSEIVSQTGFSFYANDYFHLSQSTKYFELSFNDLKEIIPDASEDLYHRVIDVLNSYSDGKIRVRDVPMALVARAGLLIDQAVLVSGKAIPLRVRSTGLVIRSYMASAWVSALSVLYSRYPSPQAYFTIGRVFDPTYEKVRGRYHVSGVIVGNTSVSQIEEIVFDVLKNFHISPDSVETVVGDTLFIPKTYRTLMFKGVKFGYVAQLSFTSLEKQGVEDPVVIFDIDLLSMYRAMGKEPLSDLYPWLLGEWYIPDEEIASHIRIARKPETVLGREILVSILKNTDLYSTQPAPCEFKVYEKEFDEKALEVWLVGYDKALVGSGFNNEVVVYKGNVLAIPPVGDHEALLNGVRTGIKVGEALANYVARMIEREPLKPVVFQVDRTSLDNINLYIPKQIHDYVNHIGADINLEVPASFRVESRVKKLWVYKKGH